MKQFSYEVWSLIFSMLEPFNIDHSNNNNNTTNNDHDPNINTNANQLMMENIKNWTHCRSRSRLIHYGLKYGITKLDLSGCVSSERDRMILKTIRFVEDGDDDVENRRYIQKCRNVYPWDDQALIKKNPRVGIEFERQDWICKLLEKYLVENFACLMELNLNCLHRLRQDQLESIGFNQLKRLSICNCRNVKQLNLDKFVQLERISIHVSQIDLRINMLEQIANMEKENSPRIPELVIQEGHEVLIKYITTEIVLITIDFSYRTIDLKRVCERSWNVDQIKLIFAGKQLEDQRQLVEYSITRGTTMHCVKRLSQ